MSANEPGARAHAAATRREPPSGGAGPSAASNGASTGANGPAEGTLSAMGSRGAVPHESTQSLSPPPPPPPDTEDEETESEVEMDELDTIEDAPTPPPPPPQESPPPRELEMTQGIEDPDSEEEDEAFPPVQLTPRSGGDRDASNSEDDDAFEPNSYPSTAPLATPVRRVAVDQETKHSEHNDEVEYQPRPAVAPMRRVEVEEKKQEGGNDDDDDDDEDDSYEEARPRRTSSGRGREKTHINVAPDIELLRLAASEAPIMAAADKKMPVWNDWARKLSHRFHSGRALQARLAWLQTVLRDPSHGEHGRLTDEMKKLMKVFNVATGSVKPPRASPKRRTIIGFMDPAKRRKLKQQRAQGIDSKSAKPLTPPSKPSVEKPAPGPGTPKNQDEPPLDAVAEEKLMRAVVKLAPEFRAAEDKMDVWTKIAAASRGRYDTGFRVRAHVRWLVKVFREPTHREHGKLAPALSDLVANFLHVTGQPLTATGPTTPRGSDAKNGDAKSAPKKVKSVVIRPNGDSQLMQLVLDKRPFAASSNVAASIWSNIAKAMGSIHPKITDGPSALARLNVILKVFNDASHPNHNDFTKKLNEQIAAYQQILSSFRANLSVLKRRVMYDDSSEASAEEVKIIKPRALGEGADLAVALKPSLEKPRRTSRSVVVASTPLASAPTNVELVSGAYGRKPTLPVNAEADELLLRVLLEKEPWKADRFERGNVWKEVAVAMQDVNPRITNGVSAMGRVRTLQAVVNTPDHVDHGRLTPALRKLLKEVEKYSGKGSKSTQEEERVPKSAQSSDDEYLLPQLSKKRKEPGTAETIETTEAAPPSTKRGRSETTSEVSSARPAKTVQAKAGSVADETLLREVLRARPFHSERSSAWDEVAIAVDKSLSQPTFHTGTRALSRVKKLLSALHAPHEQSDIRLTERQSKMADLIEALLKVKWLSDESLLTDKQRHLQERIRQLLVETTDPEETVVQVMTMKSADAPVADTPKANGGIVAVTKDHSRTDVRDDEPDEAPLPEMRIVPRPDKELTQLRFKLSEANKQCDQLRIELEAKKQLEAQVKLRHEQVNALQDEVIRLRSAAASDRASFETHLQSLQDEIASYHTQLASQAKRLDQERRDHRDELRGIVAMLQSERVAHERDTATMLDVVHREREDRREEFVAMMNLVTRSVLQAEPPAATTTASVP